MIRKHNPDEWYTAFICPACGHEYREYFPNFEQDKNYNEPFIYAEEVVDYKTPEDTYRRNAVYICPNCGILQIDPLGV